MGLTLMRKCARAQKFKTSGRLVVEEPVGIHMLLKSYILKCFENHWFRNGFAMRAQRRAHVVRVVFSAKDSRAGRMTEYRECTAR